MKTTNTIITALFFSLTTIHSQNYYRPSEALKNPESVENLIIIPEKDDLMRMSMEGKKFKNIKTVKIRGGSKETPLDLSVKLISQLPSVEKIIVESSEVHTFPNNTSLNPTIKTVEFYENDMLDLEDFIETLTGKKINKIVTDVFDLRDIPKNIVKLTELKELLIIDRNSLPFDKNKGYSLDDPDIRTSIYSLNKTDGHKVQVAYKSTQHFPNKAELEYLIKCFDAKEVQNMSSAINFEKKYNKIFPPFEGVKKQKEIFSVNTSKEQIIETDRNNYIKIPENAFVDKTGRPVRGNIDIGFREYLTPIEILTSGIPMKFDSSGTIYNFKSGGMFEITASVNNEEVFLSKDKKIEIDYALVDTIEDYNLYYLDDKGAQWNELAFATNSSIFGGKKQFAISRGMEKYFEMIKSNKAIAYDSTRWEFRFNNMNYHANIPKKGVVKELEVRKNEFQSIEKLIKITQSGYDAKKSPVIKISHYFSCNPELSFFNHFRIVFEGNNNLFNQKIKNKYFNDARIEEIKGGIVLKLKNEEEIISAPIRIEKTSNNGIPIKSMIHTKKAIRNYNEMLVKKRKGHNLKIFHYTNIEDGMEVFSKEEIMLAAYKKNKDLMTARERKMNYHLFERYRDSLKFIVDNQEIANLASSINEARILTRSNQLKRRRIIINNTGIYNCDKFIKENLTSEFTVNLKKEGSDDKIKIKSVSLLQDNGNIVYTALENEKIQLPKNQNYYLMGISENGKLLWLKNNLFSSNDLALKKNNEFTCQEIEKYPTTLEEMKQLTGIK
jgi:hypothetical protein